MKLAVRVAAFAFVIVAAVAGNPRPNVPSPASVHRTVMTASLPIPMCNPFREKCPNIR
jgi:hypothetical protein